MTHELERPPDPAGSPDPDGPPPSESWAELQRAWQAVPGPAELTRLDQALAQSVSRRESLARTVRWRNWREQLAAVVLVVMGLSRAVAPGPGLLRLGFGLMAAAGAWIALWIHRRGSNLPPPDPGASTAAYLAHEAAQLDRQIDLLSHVRTGYLAPMVPGLAVVELHALLSLWQHPTTGRPGWQAGAIFVSQLLVIVGVFGGVDALNHRAVRRLRQRRLELWPAPGPGEPDP